MFDNLSLQSTYCSYEVDIANFFYNPVLTESVSFDRVSAYFSGKALTAYSQGLEYFAKQGYQYRLIISSEISEEDYTEIKNGYELKQVICDEMAQKLRQELSLEEGKNISNLAYMISIGVVEIKIAFTTKGIFHDKFGVCKDTGGNIVCFRGSNNETQAALDINYEAFDVTCSWCASEFDYQKIINSIETFNKLWNNEQDRITVVPAPEAILKEIISYNKGKIIVDKVLLHDDCVILDRDDDLIMYVRLTNPAIILGSPFYKLRIKRYVTRIEKNTVFFDSGLSYIDYKRIIDLISSDAKIKAYKFYETDRLHSYISARNIHIESRSRLGIELKHQDAKLTERFDVYKDIVDAHMARKLREKQMWDSFFMFAMIKSGNFSVPGSGKTASVLGMYAYLKIKGLVRIIMIGPKSAFGSWIDEFEVCFKGKEKLKLFNIQDNIYKSVKDRKQALTFDTGDKNLLLFNYESIGTYEKELKSLIDENTLLVFDEIHKVKAIDGYRASFALEISKNATYTVVMSGTPIPNSYTDIYNLLQILFINEYRDFFGFSVQALRHPSEMDRQVINDRLQPFFCRTTKQQLKVPAANQDSIVSVNANSAENKLLNILSMKYRSNKLTLIIRLLQLESNPNMLLNTLDISEFQDILDDSGDPQDIDYADYSEEVIALIKTIDRTSKLTICINLIESLVNQQKPVIVWCIFIDSINRLREELEVRGITTNCIYGEVELDERGKILSNFKKGNFDVLITNPHTLGESVSLHNICHDAVYFECSYNLVHLLQSKDRIHRLGLQENQYTQYYYLQVIFKKSDDSTLYSLDEQIYLRLQDKERIMLEAIDNEVLESVSTTAEDLDIIFNKLF